MCSTSSLGRSQSPSPRTTEMAKIHYGAIFSETLSRLSWSEDWDWSRGAHSPNARDWQKDNPWFGYLYRRLWILWIQFIGIDRNSRLRDLHRVRSFCNCDSLSSATIPNTITFIGGHTFHYFSSLAAIVTPDSITSIGSRDFRWCVSLTSVVIPDSVVFIGKSPFSVCPTLEPLAMESITEQTSSD